MHNFLVRSNESACRKSGRLGAGTSHVLFFDGRASHFDGRNLTLFKGKHPALHT